MQSRSNLFLAIVVGLTALSVLALFNVGPFDRDLRLGIDVQGGIRMIYSVEQTEDSKEQRRTLEEDRATAIRTLQSRVDVGLGVTEGTVAAKGSNQIVVELPGFTNIEDARKMMGSTARLQAFHARNVTTALRRRIYTKADEKMEKGTPVVYFQKSAGGEQFGPRDPEYIEMISQWDLILEGNDLANAQPLTLPDGSVVPEFRFSDEGARKMEAWTRSVMDQGEQLAFVIDGVVLSIAPIKERTILRHDAFIDGEFEPAAVRQLTTLLREGALEVILKPESEENIDPSIGKGAIDQIVVAGAVSYGLICLFLIVYYGVPGFVAALAMILYGLYTLTALKYLNATFSLAAIAGFILSLGMAVDANILVFERIKEELRSGRQLQTAAELGFKRALSAIVDSNACTIITSIVLYVLGSGPVKGFATTLIWGVLISFFTAITVTRALLFTAMKTGIANDPKHFALKRSWFGEKFEAQAETKPLNIVGRTRTWFTISVVLILGGLIAALSGGIKPNVEFGGGYEGVYEVTDANATLGSIRQNLVQAGFEDANVKLGTAVGEGGNSVRIAYVTVPPDAQVSQNTDEAKQQIAEAAGLSTAGTSSFTKIGPTIQKETVTNAYLGVIIATGLIIMYIAVRFGVALGGMKNGIKFGLSAITALVHDALFVVGMAGIMGIVMGWEISSLFITAMLTVIGFSVHDTIVIFDRIRENLRRPHKGETFDHLVDKSVTQTVARSINTSMMAFITLLILVFFGTTVPEIKFMCLTMAAGIAVGTYSSIFNASPVLWLWNRATMKRRGEQADLMAEAQREAKLRAKVAIESDDRVYRDESGGTYGQVKRRSSAVDKATHDIDED